VIGFTRVDFERLSASYRRASSRQQQRRCMQSGTERQARARVRAGEGFGARCGRRAGPPCGNWLERCSSETPSR
jgi:hypothetical protein